MGRAAVFFASALMMTPADPTALKELTMTPESGPRALQAPHKNRYRDDPASARETLVAEGTPEPATVACRGAD